MPKGLIVGNISNVYEVLLDEEKQNIIKCVPRGKLKNNGVIPVVGDFVEVGMDSEFSGVINEILPRKNFIKRPKIANITQMLLIVSMKMPKPDLLLLDKQLVYAEYNGIKPVICLNKIDLEDEKKVDSISKIYEDIGYKVIRTDAKNKVGLDTVLECLKENITVFSGNSGVGKSTLINNIFSDNLTEEGEVSQKNKRGKNTTTSVKLYKLGEKTYIADTPRFLYI